jgi:hypothetical protein
MTQKQRRGEGGVPEGRWYLFAEAKNETSAAEE